MKRSQVRRSDRDCAKFWCHVVAIYVADSRPFGKQGRSATARKPETQCGLLYSVSHMQEDDLLHGGLFCEASGHFFLFTVVGLACVVSRVRLTREVASPVVGIPVRGPHKGRADMRTSVLQVCKLSSCVMPAC